MYSVLIFLAFACGLVKKILCYLHTSTCYSKNMYAKFNDDWLSSFYKHTYIQIYYIVID